MHGAEESLHLFQRAFMNRSEPEAWLEFATVDGCIPFLAFGAGGAISPTQVEFRPEREDHLGAIHVSLKAYPFFARRQREVKGPAEYDRIKLTNI